MVRRVEVVLEDDLTGGKAAETVTFGLDGTRYEIDLSAKNAAAMRKSLKRFVDAARTNRKPRRRTTRVVGGSSARDIREWAVANGHEVSDKGRIPAPIREAYEAAH